MQRQEPALTLQEKSSNPEFDQQIFAERRRKLMQDIGSNIIIIPGASKKTRNKDNTYPFRQESNFYYLTGFEEPNAVAILIPERKEGEYILFCEPHDPSMETFVGKRAGQEGACKLFGAMQTCKPNISENKLSRKIMDEFMDHGLNTNEVAYPNIVGSGKNGCTLHYEKNNSIIKDGELVLIDAGGEYKNYASDITRTFPANGKFTKEQRAIYDLVLKTQEACIKAIKPGVLYVDIHKLSERLITEGLIELGILKGDLDKLLEENACNPFYMHAIGHEMGLDVHDAGMSRRGLQPGMVLTVEPGIYISDSIPNADPKWHNIGIRIEDDVLVTEDGCKVLSSHLPKQADEIEAIMAGQVPEAMQKLGYKDKSANKNGNQFKIFSTFNGPQVAESVVEQEPQIKQIYASPK